MKRIKLFSMAVAAAMLCSAAPSLAQDGEQAAQDALPAPELNIEAEQTPMPTPIVSPEPGQEPGAEEQESVLGPVLVTEDPEQSVLEESKAGTGTIVGSGDYWHESMDQYQKFNYSDPNHITDENFFGKWNAASASWDKTPYLDYSLDAKLREAEEFAKVGNYEQAKESVFQYYRYKFMHQPRSYSTTNDRREILAADILFDNLFFNKATGFNPIDKISVSQNQAYVGANIIEEVKSAASSTSKEKCFVLVALKKDGYQATFNTKEAAQNTPYVVVEVNGSKRTYYPTKDAMLQAGDNAGKNFGSQPTMGVQEDCIDQAQPINSNTKRGYINFDFSDLNSGDIITSATMYLYGNTNKPEGTKDVVVFANTNATWTESTIKWSSVEHLVFSYDGESGPKWVQPSTAGYRFEEEINRFENYMSMLERRYRYDHEQVYAYHGIRILLDFIVKKGGTPGWRVNLDLGVRGQNIPTMCAYFMDSEFMTKETFIPILKQAWLTANQLVLNWNNQSATTNWGAYETAGLSNLAINFNEFYDATKPLTSTSNGGRGGWLEVSAHRYELLGGTILNSDGSSTEVSLGYTSEAIGNTMQQVTFAEAAGWSDFKLAENLQKLLTGLGTYLVNASGPNFSDFQQGNAYAYTSSYISTIKRVAKETNDPLLVWAATDGKDGTPPDYTSVLYPVGIKAILKSGWGDDDTFIQMNADGGNHSHGHFDDLTINMFAYGNYLLADPRYMNYDNNNPYRAWLNSTRAHNTVEINDVSQKGNSWNFSETVKGPTGETISLPTGGARGKIERSEVNDAYDYVKMSTPNNLNVTIGGALKNNVAHSRSVLFIKPGYAIVTDYLEPRDDKVNKYSQGWHFQPDAAVTMDQSSKSVRTNFADKANIQIIPVAQDQAYEAEVKDGYYSFGTGNVTDAKYVTYTKNVSGNTTFNTVLLPIDTGDDLEGTTQKLQLNVDEKVANAFELVIADKKTGANTYGSYYTLVGTEGKAQRNFGQYGTDGAMSYIQKDDREYNQVILQNGTNVSNEDDEILLIKSLVEIPDLSVTYNASDIELNTSAKIDLSKLTVYANGRKTQNVTLNGQKVFSTQGGRYVYFGKEPIIDDDTPVPTPTPTPGAGNPPSGGGTHGGGGSGTGSGTGGGPVVNPTTPTPTPSEQPTPTPEIPEAFARELEGHWGRTEITEMIRRGMVTGVNDQTLGLTNPTTRAEFVTMAVRALELEIGGYGGEFADISEGDWYAPYFSAAGQAGMIEGTGGYANPDALITREEMAKILVSMYESKNGEIPLPEQPQSFLDEAVVSDWAKPYVKKAVAAGLMQGMDGGIFAPRDTALREQAIVVVYRLRQKLGM